MDFDLTLTVPADLLYRRLGERLKGFARAGPSKLYRKFVDTPGAIQITAQEVIVHLSKRAHNPLLKQRLYTRLEQARYRRSNSTSNLGRLVLDRAFLMILRRFIAWRWHSGMRAER